jgi:hypothetical protein
MLLIDGVPIVCINQAAIEYHVPAPLIVSVLKTEGGRVGQLHQNPNQTVDYGPMQINSSWLPLLKNHGFTPVQVEYDPCVNVQIGTWILAQTIADCEDVWKGVGDYHSHTRLLNFEYQYKVFNAYSKLIKTVNA